MQRYRARSTFFQVLLRLLTYFRIIAVATVFVATLIILPAHADLTSDSSSDSGAASQPFRTRVGAVGSTLYVNGEPVAKFITSAGGVSPHDRAQAASDRLKQLLATGTTAAGLDISQADSGWTVTAQDTNILLATPSDASAQGVRPKVLAQGWLNNLRKQLTEAPFIPSQPGLVIPVGESRSVAIGGAALPTAVGITDTTPTLSNSHFDSATRILTVRGLSAGQTEIVIADPDENAAPMHLPIRVENYAAHILPSITITVSGSPAATSDQVNQALYCGLEQAVQTQPGARMDRLSVPNVAAINAGSSANFTVALTASGTDLLPVSGSTQVSVVNSPVTAAPAQALLYSNDPESVKHAQQLFLGKLQPQQVARLDYHHQNVSGAPLMFHVDLVNPSDTPAMVYVASGIAVPGLNTFQVGRRAGAAFMAGQIANAGLTVNIPSHSQVRLISQRLPDSLTASGIVQMLQTAGPSDGVRVAVSMDQDSSVIDAPIAAASLNVLGRNALLDTVIPLDPTSDAAAKTVFSNQVYEAPLIERDASYTVGGPWAYLNLGHTAGLKGGDGGKLSLAGNYGATYQISFDLVNPTDQTKIVGLYFTPEAGYAAGVFQVNGGPLQEYDPIEPPNERELTRVTLNGGQHATVTVQTLALNGSFYPVSLVAHVL